MTEIHLSRWFQCHPQCLCHLLIFPAFFFFFSSLKPANTKQNNRIRNVHMMCTYVSVEVLPVHDGLDPHCASWRRMSLVAPCWFSFVLNLQTQNTKQRMQVTCMHAYVSDPVGLGLPPIPLATTQVFFPSSKMQL